MVEIVQLLQTFGLAVGMLLVLAAAIWRVLLWLRPFAEKAIAAHLEMVARTTESLAQFADAQERLGEALDRIADRLDRIEAVVSGRAGRAP